MPIIINKHTVEITHGTQKHTQTTWFVPELRHQRYYCRALRWKSNWSPAIEMSSMLRSRCSSLERWGKSSPKCWWPLLACRDKPTAKMLPWNSDGPVSWKSGSYRRCIYTSGKKTLCKSCSDTVSNLWQGPGDFFSSTETSHASRLTRALTVSLGRSRAGACQVPHRQTHGVKSNWPLLLLITNWTKLSNLTPGLEAVPAPLQAMPPLSLPQKPPRAARLPCGSRRRHALHSPSRHTMAPWARKAVSAPLCSLNSIQIKEKLYSFHSSRGYELKKMASDLPYEKHNRVLHSSTHKLHPKMHDALKYTAATWDAR